MPANDTQSEFAADLQKAGGERHDRPEGAELKPKRAGGNHTAVCSVRANAALDLGLEEGLAYLVLARGTGGDQRTTKWSVNSIESREILGRIAAGRAIAQLEAARLVGKPNGARGRKHLRKLAEPAIIVTDGKSGLVNAPRIWFPNVLVDGVSGGKSPLALIRETRNPDVLRLLLRCYEVCDLSHHGGVPPTMMAGNIDMKELGLRAQWRIFGLENKSTRFTQDFAGPCFSNPADSSKRFWTAWNLLRSLHIVEQVAYILDGPPGKGELLFPVGWGEEPEVAHYSAMDDAARHLLIRTERGDKRKGDVLQGFNWFAVVPRHVTQPHACLLFRPRYLPDTQPNREWRSKLERWKASADAWKKVMG